MIESTFDSGEVVAAAQTNDPAELVRLGISAAKGNNFERARAFLAEAYRLAGADQSRFSPIALSYYGLCLAMQKGRIREAVEFCQLAIDREFYNAELYENLGRVFIAGRSRRKAVDALEKGLALDPGNKRIRRLRDEIGIRRRPVIPFLHRDNPLNVSLGRMRQQIKQKKLGKG